MAENQNQGKDIQLAKSKAAAEKSRITLPNKIDIQFMEDAQGARDQSLEGFNPRYKDFVDYIIGITHEIWEEKGIGKLYDYYASTIQLHTSSGTVYGREAVFAGTIQTMAAFPDRRLYGDEVIWGRHRDSLYSSHRITHAGTNRGWTIYGPPTGKKVEYSAIADCLCRRNMVVEEWLVRDELTLVLQLGLNPVETARKMAADQRDGGAGYRAAGDIERGIGQLPPAEWQSPAGEDFDPQDFVGRMIHEIWNWRLLNKAREFYHENFAFSGPTRRQFTGVNDFHAYVLSLLSAFPDLAIYQDHSCVVGDAEAGYRVATRWTMRGTHTGVGIYGEPTGSSIRILGVSHHLVKDGRIQNEWTLFDEFALLKQIHA